MSKKLTLEEAQGIAKERGGKCLSKTYVNNRSKLTWQCSSGHVWKASLAHVKCNKSWCPRCHFDNLKLSLDIAIKIATKKRWQMSV